MSFSTLSPLEDVFPGDSMMSAAMRSFDWTSTALAIRNLGRRD